MGDNMRELIARSVLRTPSTFYYFMSGVVIGMVTTLAVISAAGIY